MKKISLGISSHINNIICKVLLTVLVLLAPISTFAAPYGGGSGTEEDPYILSKPEHILELAEVTSFSSTYMFFRLDADIDMKDIQFKMIGGNSGFEGVFDGNNHKISNVTYISEEEDNVGFFSQICESRILNVEFENVNIKGKSYVGGCAGVVNESVLNNVSVSGTVAAIGSLAEDVAGSFAGGVAGAVNDAVLKNVSVSGKVAATGSVVGGVAGYLASSEVGNIKNSADVYAEYGSNPGIMGVGGVFGHCSFSSIYYSFNSGYVVSEGEQVGGIIGYASYATDVYYSVNVGKVSGRENFIGGIVGYSLGGRVDLCVNAGTVLASSNKVSCIGGVCGYLTGERIESCVNSGFVKGTNNSFYVGGCIGKFEPDYQCLKTSLNVGSVSASGEHLGAVVGYRTKPDITACYYDKTLLKLTDKEAKGLSLDSIRFEPNLNSGDWMRLDSFLYPVPNMKESVSDYKYPDDFNEILYFASLPVPFDSVSADKCLMSQFELYPVKGVSYSSSTGCLQVKGNSVGLAKIGEDTLFIRYKNSERVIPVCVGTIDTLLFSGGKGTKAKPYMLTTIEDVRKLAEMVNGEVSYDDESKNWSYGKYFYLANDIAEPVNFVIGNRLKGDVYSFQGYFDGGGHSLALSIESSASAALFGFVDSEAEIKALAVKGNVSGGDFAAGVCGVLNNATLKGCYNGARVLGANFVGGVCASAEDGAKIIGCANSGTVKGRDEVGGVVGFVKGGNSVVERGLNVGFVSGTDKVGGVVGLLEEASLTASVGAGSVNGASAGAVCGANNLGNVASLFFDSRMLQCGDEFAEGVITDSLCGSKILNRLESDPSLWLLEDGRYALPAELNGVTNVNFASFCIPLDSENSVGDVSADFSVLTEGLELSWNSVGGNILFEDGTAKLTKWGVDTLQVGLGDGQIREILVTLTYPIFSGGRGTEKEPYVIMTYDDMKFFEKVVNTNMFAKSSSKNWSCGKYFRVEADVVADTIRFVVGDGRSDVAYFGGDFNGGGHEFLMGVDSLNKVVLNKPVGLFGTIKNAKVDSVRVTGSVKGTDCVGGVCGYSENSQINASVNSANILGLSYVGGICGLAKDNFEVTGTYSLSSALNIGYVSGDSCVGGIVGKTDSCGVKMLVNTGVVTAEQDYVGGIAGVASGSDKASVYSKILNFSSFKVQKENKNYGALCGKFEGRMMFGYYDKQMTSSLLGGVAKKDYDNNNNIVAMGMSTDALTNGSLFDDVFFSIDMTGRNGFYPCPAAIDDFTEAKLAVTPVRLNGDEFIGMIKSDFTVPDSFGVISSSLHSCFTVNATKNTLVKSGDEVVGLSLGKYFKRLTAFVAKGLFSGGNGREESPFLIKTKKDMEDLASLVNQNAFQSIYDMNWSYGNYFSLQNDILTDTIRTIVGEGSTDSGLDRFDGVFYGNGYTVNVEIESEFDNVGVFGVVGYGAVDSLNVKGRVSGAYNVGGICGKNTFGNIKGCSNEASVKGKGWVGGVSGFNKGVISYSGNIGTVLAEGVNIGGISGVCENGAVVNYSVNAGSVRSAGETVGGIVGKNSGGVSDCLNSGFISGAKYVGGICGEMLGGSSNLLKNCLNAGVVYSNGLTSYIGDIYGKFNSQGVVEGCFSDSQMCTVTAVGEALDTESLLVSDNFAHWLRADSLYPRPFDSKLTFLAASPVYFDKNDVHNSVDSAFYCSNADSLQWSSSSGLFKVSGGKSKLLYMGNDTIKAILNGMQKEVPIKINCLTSYDTVSFVGCDSFVYKRGDETFAVYSDTSFVDSLVNCGKCDSLLSVSIKVQKSSFLDTVINGCDSVVFGGVVFKDSVLVRDTIKNSVGCDSIIFARLNVYKTNKDSLFIIEGCDSVVYDGVVYRDNLLISDTLKSNVCDCDSLVFGVQILVNKKVRDTVNVKGCGVAEYGGVEFFSDTSFVDSLKTKSGCDSLVLVNVVIGHETKSETSKSACDSIFYVNAKGKRVKYTESIVFNDTLVNYKGCDSVLTVNIEIKKSDFVADTFYGCEKFRYIDTVKLRSAQGVISYIYKDEYILKDTVIRYELKNENFCDSIREVHFDITAPSYKELTRWGQDSVEYNGIVFYEDTVYHERFECDSVVKVLIFVYYPVHDTLNLFGCESVEFEGVTYSKDTVLNMKIPPLDRGSDTFRIVNIKVADPILEELVVTGCGSVDYEGRLFESDDELIETYKSVQGCDSLIRKVIIRIRDKKEGPDSIVVGCDSVLFEGTYFKENATIERIYESADGCDSIVKIHLKVVEPIVESRTENGCDSLSYKGVTYYKDTTLVEHYLSVNGCDSTVNVNIKIGFTEEGTVKLASCGRVKFDDEYFYNDTSFVRVYANASGCDSIVNVEIDVWEVSNTKIVIDSMTQVTYDDKVYYRSTVLRDTLTNSMGCDSFVTVFINVEKSLDVPLIVNKHDYVLFCNNTIYEEKFVAYQWYKNEVPVAGATKDYYTEEVLLNGCFQVYVTTVSGKEFASETICFEEGRKFSLYPNPVAVGESVMVNYEFTEEEQFNLLIEVFNSNGICVFRGEPSSYPIEISGRTEPGYYYVLITTGKGDTLGDRFIVK